MDLARRSKPRENKSEREARLADEAKRNSHELEETSRRNEHERDEEGKQKDHDRGKELLIVRSTVGLVVATALVSFLVLLIPAFPEDIRKWGAVSLTSILSMAVGYVGGKATK